MASSLKSGVLAVKYDRRDARQFPINANNARHTPHDLCKHARVTRWVRHLVETNKHDPSDFVRMNKLLEQGRVAEIIIYANKSDMPAEVMCMFMNAGKNTAVVGTLKHAVAGKNNPDVVSCGIIIRTGKDLRVFVGSVSQFLDRSKYAVTSSLRNITRAIVNDIRHNGSCHSGSTCDIILGNDLMIGIIGHRCFA